MTWRVPPDNPPVPVITASDSPSDPPRGPEPARLKPEPDSLASSHYDNDSPQTDKRLWQASQAFLPSHTPTPADAGREPSPVGIPDGGLRAWLVVVGAFIDFVVAFGLMNAFGIFQARYEIKWPQQSTSTITWIGSTQASCFPLSPVVNRLLAWCLALECASPSNEAGLNTLVVSQLFVFFGGGTFIGPAFDKYGARDLLLLGTGCCLASFIFTSWSTEFWHYLLAQGFLFGLSNALLFYPVTGAISEWFDKSRGLALGIAVSGSSVGGIIWPVLLGRLFAVMSEEAVFRVAAVVSTPLLLLSCFLVRERKQVTGKDTPGSKAQPSTTAGAIFDWRFLALSLSLMLLYTGMLIPFYYIPLYAQHHGLDLSAANNLLVVTYTGSFFGRIGAGWFADRCGRFNILSLIGTLMSVLTFGWIWMTSRAAMTAFAALFGLLSGGIGPLGSACVAQTTSDMGHIGLRIGIMMLFSSIGALSGGPLSGMLRDGPTGWVGVHGFSAGIAVAGSLLLFGVRTWFRPRLFAKF